MRAARQGIDNVGLDDYNWAGRASNVQLPIQASCVMKTPQLETTPGNGDSREDRPEIVTLDPRFVTGLCEGTATFTYARNGTGLNLRFGLKLGASDRDLAFSILNHFAVGNIYRVGAGPDSVGGKQGNGTWFFCVTSVVDLDRIVTHFDRYPFVGRKADNYRIWRSMYELKRNHRKTDTDALNALAQALSGLSAKGRRNVKPVQERAQNG